MKKKHTNTIIVTSAIAIVVITIVVLVGLFMPQSEEVIQGQAEISDYRISSKVPGRICKIFVSEGDVVTMGDTLAILDAPDIDAKLSQAQAALDAAMALQQKTIAGERSEKIQSAYEMWQKAIAARVVAEKTYSRINQLFEAGVVAEQKRDEALANYQAMQATENATKVQYDMAVNGARNEDKLAATAQTNRAEGAVREISSYSDETVLTAPADGIIAEIFPEVGELVGTGAPIMNIAKNNEAWFIFNIREDYLPGLTVGSTVSIYVPAFDRNINAKITTIKDVGSFATWKATKALDKYDLKTFEVKITPVNAAEASGIKAGMSAILNHNNK